jgi:hypothetical protein
LLHHTITRFSIPHVLALCGTNWQSQQEAPSSSLLALLILIAMKTIEVYNTKRDWIDK